MSEAPTGASAASDGAGAAGETIGGRPPVAGEGRALGRGADGGAEGGALAASGVTISGVAAVPFEPGRRGEAGGWIVRGVTASSSASRRAPTPTTRSELPGDRAEKSGSWASRPSASRP